MNFKAILNRLTGLSCPIFGISWNPIESEIIIATRIIRYLETGEFFLIRVKWNLQHIVLNLPFKYENILHQKCKI